MPVVNPVPEYVLGFYFLGPRQDAVVLIRKNKPEFQAGKLNGVGGRIEPGETPLDAMFREFREETGKTVHQWTQFARMEFSDATVYCFHSTGDQCGIRFGDNSPTAERVETFFVDQLRYYTRVLPNLRWLIPMACVPEKTVLVIRCD